MFNDQMLGKRLTKLHNATDDSQEDAVKGIAARMGISIHQTTFSAYLRGVKWPTLPVLSALADYYNVSIDYLLGKTDDSTPVPTLVKNLEQSSLPAEIESAAKMLTELPEADRGSLVAQIKAAYAEAKERQQNRETLEYLARFLNVDGDRLYQIIKGGTPSGDRGSILQSAVELIRH